MNSIMEATLIDLRLAPRPSRRLAASAQSNSTGQCCNRMEQYTRYFYALKQVSSSSPWLNARSTFATWDGMVNRIR